MKQLPASLVRPSIQMALAFREDSDTLSWGHLTTIASEPKEMDKKSARAGGGLGELLVLSGQ